jgi:transposase
MRTRRFRLTEQQASELQAAFLHCQDADTKTRFQAVRLYGLGHPVAQLTDICACSPRSLLHWARAYQNGGLSALIDHRQGGNRAKLRPEQIERLMKQLHQYSPAQLLGREACVGQGQFWSVPDLARLLERDYGVTYQSLTSYRSLLQRCELSYQRPAKVYKSRSEAKVMAFEEQLEKKAGRHGSERSRDGARGRG